MVHAPTVRRMVRSFVDKKENTQPEAANRGLSMKRNAKMLLSMFCTPKGFHCEPEVSSAEMIALKSLPDFCNLSSFPYSQPFCAALSTHQQLWEQSSDYANCVHFPNQASRTGVWCQQNHRKRTNADGAVPSKSQQMFLA